MTTQIYGMIGYTILHNSNIFPDTEILLICDMHTEPYKDCFSYDYMDIDKLIKIYLDKKYKIFIEEVPNNNNLIEIFPHSRHVKNIRKLYLDNSHDIVGFDIRLNLFDTQSTTDSDKLSNSFIKLFDYFVISNGLYENLLTEQEYMKNLIRFRNFVIKYGNEMKKKYVDVDKNIYLNMLDEIEELLSRIIEFECFCKLCESLQHSLQKKPNKFVIYCGLVHSEKLVEMIKKYLKYTIKVSKGINKMIQVKNTHVDSLCMDLFDF